MMLIESLRHWLQQIYCTDNVAEAALYSSPSSGLQCIFFGYAPDLIGLLIVLKMVTPRNEPEVFSIINT